MILKLKLKNIDDNYAWHFVDGVENVAVEKTELGNIKSITYNISKISVKFNFNAASFFEFTDLLILPHPRICLLLEDGRGP